MYKYIICIVLYFPRRTISPWKVPRKDTFGAVFALPTELITRHMIHGRKPNTIYYCNKRRAKKKHALTSVLFPFHPWDFSQCLGRGCSDALKPTALLMLQFICMAHLRKSEYRRQSYAFVSSLVTPLTISSQDIIHGFHVSFLLGLSSRRSLFISNRSLIPAYS